MLRCFLPFFAWIILGEVVTRKELGFIFITIVGIMILLITVMTMTSQVINQAFFLDNLFHPVSIIYHVSLLFIGIIFFSYFSYRKKSLGVFYGVLSGMLAGYAQLIARPLTVMLFSDFLSALFNPLIWLMAIVTVLFILGIF